jgi:acyl-CoA thioesterase II
VQLISPTTGHTAADIGHRRCAFRARAWWGQDLIAESSAAIVLTEPGQPAALYFPPTDVRLDTGSEGDEASCPVKGTAQLWTLPGEVPPANAGAWSADDQPDLVNGEGAAWTFTHPASDLDWLRDRVAFDSDRVRVELVDAMEGADPRDESVKRFPVWGDSDDLIDILRVRPEGDGRFTAPALADEGRPVVEGSQMLGQAIVAAGSLAPGRRIVSAHMVFFRPADARLPLEFELTEHSSGRSFSTLGVSVIQAGKPRAAGTLLLDVTAPDLIRHAEPAPPAPGPYDSVPYDMSVTGRDLRVVDAAYTDDPQAPVGPPVIDAWVRFRGPLDDDPALHAGLLAQFTGHMPIAAALRAHAGIGQAEAHRSISTGINAIALSFHREVRADQWMRYHHHSTFAGSGMTHAECRAYTEDGDLLASFAVEAMVRGFADPSQQGNARTAM